MSSKLHGMTFAAADARITFGKTLSVRPTRNPADPPAYFVTSANPIVELCDKATEDAARELAARMDGKPLTIRGTTREGKAVRYRFTKIRATHHGKTVIAYPLVNKRNSYGTCIVR